MTIFRYLAVVLTLISLSGCAGVFVAGAATTATIITDTRSTKEIWNDNNIEFEVAGLGNKAPFRGQLRVTASSHNGTVVLMGQAKTQSDLDAFIAEAKQLKGVTTLHNQVRINEPLSVTAISNDSWITTKVKSALLTNTELNGIKVKVITEDKEVFLLGYVSPHHADIATEVARNISGVKQVIRAFQNVD
ncbi:BON domain-containing protein [Vibrio sp. YMD68]|uniref:BON domain-containing protein n=1 Tax=Vibrio sp. YMD68 TaxID=3042300 RepID=UPI00249A2022|nr:BON domain-containing protein [Vibrio sp. YMD68]WGW00809.1 BON domain-containing protein [Vibrio sp. YMD68]